jgi:hypothetical protein
VILPEGSFTPAMAEIRPLMAAEPMFRAPRPEMVAELYGACSPWDATAQRHSAVDNEIFSKRMMI